MFNAHEIASNYLDTWNEQDAARRAELIARNWAPQPTYVDPLMQAEGGEQISALIGAVHDRFPGFRFTLKGAADGHGDYVRFGWGLGPSDAEPVIEGSDVIRLQDRRMKDVIGFLDKVPDMG